MNINSVTKSWLKALPLSIGALVVITIVSVLVNLPINTIMLGFCVHYLIWLIQIMMDKDNAKGGIA